jgi:CubicO group peptidase (beta-lactamase class C family)
MRSGSYVGLVAVVAVAAIACSTRETAVEIGSPEDSSPEAVRSFLDSVVRQGGAPPSISVAVAVGGEVVLAEAVGQADIKGEVAATPETSYRVYSISKGITAVGVMQLVEQGKLNLGDDIRDSVPGFPQKSMPISIEQLLTHTSGIRHYKKNAGEISSRVEYASLTDSLEVFKEDPLEFEPGADYKYTSFGFNLLTGAIERGSGLGFGEYLDARVFGPAGMTSSHLDASQRSDPKMAAGHSPGKRPVEVPNVSGRYGSSGVVSTPTDLVRLCVALDESQLLRPETLERMYAIAHPELSEQQAFGWRVTENEGRRLVYASGGGIGFTGLVFHYPDEHVTGAVLVNEAEFEERVDLLNALLAVYLDD